MLRVVFMCNLRPRDGWKLWNKSRERLQHVRLSYVEQLQTSSVFKYFSFWFTVPGILDTELDAPDGAPEEVVRHHPLRDVKVVTRNA